MGQAGVVGVYCVHGTFTGNDVMGLMTEMTRIVPSLSRTLSRFGKQTVDLLAGEMGNFTPAYTATMEAGLSAGAGRTIPVLRFNWSSQNNHIGRADGAVRLLGSWPTWPVICPTCHPAPAAVNPNRPPPRVVLWGHSHAGNLFALLTTLLVAGKAARKQFFQATRCFYRSAGADGLICQPGTMGSNCSGRSRKVCRERPCQKTRRSPREPPLPYVDWHLTSSPSAPRSVMVGARLVTPICSISSITGRCRIGANTCPLSPRSTPHAGRGRGRLCAADWHCRQQYAAQLAGLEDRGVGQAACQTARAQPAS